MTVYTDDQLKKLADIADGFFEKLPPADVRELLDHDPSQRESSYMRFGAGVVISHYMACEGDMSATTARVAKHPLEPMSPEDSCAYKVGTTIGISIASAVRRRFEATASDTQ